MTPATADYDGPRPTPTPTTAKTGSSQPFSALSSSLLSKPKGAEGTLAVPLQLEVVPAGEEDETVEVLAGDSPRSYRHETSSRSAGHTTDREESVGGSGVTSVIGPQSQTSKAGGGPAPELKSPRSGESPRGAVSSKPPNGFEVMPPNRSD